MDPAKGGPPNVVARLAAAQASLGHDVQVLTYGDSDARERLAADSIRVPGHSRVAYHYLPLPNRWQQLVSREAFQKCRELIPYVDVVHIHGLWETLVRYASHCARIYSIPYVIAPHGMLDPWSLSQKSLKKRFALALGYRQLLNQASLLHALNRDELELLKPLGIQAPAAVIPNGVEANEIYPLPEKGTFRATLPELGDRPFILFLSRLHYKKGLDYLAEAFKIIAQQHTDVQLVVAGPDGGAQADFESSIQQAKLTHRVHLTGPIYGERKLAAYVDATLFCLPSRQEGFSIAITEAMACGTPVVITRQCHFPEVADAGTGKVVDLSAQAIAEAALALLQDPEELARASSAGQKLVEERFLWSRVAELTAKHYARLVPKPTPL